jgi:hypothetical protein
MSARARLVVFAGASIAIGVACKTLAVETVTLDLGPENAGSAGFGCTEPRSPSCDAIFECLLKNPGRDAGGACITAQCAGLGDHSCVAFAACLRGVATGPECYRAACESPALLAARGSDGDGGNDLHLIVDYVGLGGTPGCRGAELRTWCSGHACRPIRRVCIPLHVGYAPDASPEVIQRAIADGFAAQRTLDPNAPDVPVVVRAVGVAKAGPCAPAEEAVDGVFAGPLVGCAYACPTVLASARGALTLDFDLLGTKCTEDDVRACLSFVGGDAGP